MTAPRARKPPRADGDTLLLGADVESALLLACIEDLPAGIVITDRSGVIRYANRRARAMLGPSPVTATGDRLLVEALPVSDPERVSRLLRLGAGSMEASLLSADGVATPIGLHAVALADGAATAVLLTDLSAVRRLQEEMRRTDHLAVVGQLSTGLAHEIRNPLTGISATAELLRSRLAPGDPLRVYLDTILGEVGRLDRLSRTFLEYARPPVPRLSLCSMDECVGHALEIHARALASARIEVVREDAGPIPPLYMDRDLIRQVIDNVILNAVGAMPDGGTLTIHQSVARLRLPTAAHVGRRADDPLGTRPRATGALVPMVCLHLTDTGDGIAPELLPRVFDPFYTSRPNGTGLGLPIAQAIVREHAGRIDVTSTLGVGTTVVIELPIEKRRARGPRPAQERSAS